MSLRFWHLVLLALAALAMVGCSNDDEDVELQPRQIFTDYTFARFDPASGDPTKIPLPNDLLRDPTTGQNAVPSLGDPGIDALVAQINTISGFSTSGPIIIPFEGGIRPETVNSQTVLVVDLEDFQRAAAGEPVNPIRPVTFDISTDETTGDATVLARPILPLQPGRTHLVVVTDGVIGDNSEGFAVEAQAATILTRNTVPLVDEEGRSTVEGLPDANALALEPLRQSFQPLWEAAEGVTGRQRVFIPLVFAFTTQPLFDTLPKIREKAQSAQPVATITTAIEGTAAVDAFFNLIGAGFVPHESIGAIYMGTFEAPRYIGNPLTEPFQIGADGLPVERATMSVPFLACMPLGAQGASPALIFEHGITRFKEDMFGLANGPCSNGIGVIGIDIWLHGELTDNLDVVNNETGEPGPDGVPDASGTHFINLTNLLQTRDNFRQTTSNLYYLTRMLSSGGADFNGDGASDVAPFGLTYVGQSLGGVAGVNFVTTEPNVSLAVFNNSGGRFGSLFRNSQQFGPLIEAGLAGFGIPPGSFLAELYFLVAQTIVDDADGFNYGPHAATGNYANGSPTTVLLQMTLDDPVIPNSATTDLALAVGAPQVAANTALPGLTQVPAPHLGSGLYLFENAGHGSLLDPSEGSTVEMQTQAFSFLFLGLQGTPTVIDPFLAGKIWLELGDGLQTPMPVERMNLFPVTGAIR
ncbi:Bacterial virulence factor lipase N-terminal [Sulfidibacter corallicola]|uniref:Bacterial virulence factor lipase N-terminal domain-containing protein n=1 Tax=Sulfidibacter corallicola TaxID=2818388 RepID=A0A8A4TQJ5_SULCO|nr:hypothetical protein [Sulfidibacter corallicola]QTD52239.1 hypothetical protein J3U87_07175 [Sulfidibacter corallicola]